MSQAFIELGIGIPLAAALQKSDITEPTPIQAQVVPLILAGQDVIGQSATGTGKTLAYLLPVLQSIDAAKRELQAVVLAPTYELAMQIHRQAELLIQHSALNIAVLPVIGNVNIARQIEKLKEKPQLIVGSSGRILELIQKRKISAQTIKSIVLDEADRLLEEQSFSSVKAVVKTALRDRQLCLFSATMNAGAIERAKEFSDQFVIVREAGAAAAKPDISHMYVVTEHRDKIEELRKLVHSLNIQRGLVFVNRGDSIGLTTDKLNYLGLKAAGLYGGTKKLDRKKALEDFRDGRVRLLVASDVAARGLDIAGIDYVVNLDMTDEPQVYLHRTGRTGRAGNSGVAVSIVARQEKWMVEKLEKSLRFKLAAKQITRGQVSDVVKLGQPAKREKKKQ